MHVEHIEQFMPYPSNLPQSQTSQQDCCLRVVLLVQELGVVNRNPFLLDK